MPDIQEIHMFRLQDSLMKKLVCLILLATILPMIAVAYISFTISREMLEANEFSSLADVRERETQEIYDFLHQKMADLKVLSHSMEVRDALEKVREYNAVNEGKEHGTFRTDTEAYKTFYGVIDPFFKEYRASYGYDDIYLLDGDHGYVMYASGIASDLGANLASGALKDSGLGRLWKKIHATRQPAMVDYSSYRPAQDRAALFMGKPILNPDGSLAAVLALRLGIEPLDAIIQPRTGMGETGKTYVIGQDFLLRTTLQGATSVKSLQVRMDTPYIEKAFAGQTGLGIVQNYKGTEVLSSYAAMDLKGELGADFTWCVVTEMNLHETFAPIRFLFMKIALLAGIAMVLASVVAYFVSRSIADPLKDLAIKTEAMSRDDLTCVIPPVKRKDELGVLTRAFKDLLHTLRDQTLRIIEGAANLSASISELSATSSELAATSSETSTSISEITTTVEEIRQTSQVSREKAESMATAAGAMAQIAERGKKATEDAASGMNRIREEMEYVAESIVKLSEQTQNIGTIIDAVKDLADQSNLLSVNVAIEAAKAGEYGKGFAVVAQEVKALADQSKNATEQVKLILHDVQKATSAAVMATERGSKAVEAGVQLSSQAGESIHILSKNVTTSSHAVTQIAASSQQQQVGMDQLVIAMGNIKDATRQNVDGARQLEGAIRMLNELGTTFRIFSERFKV